MAQRIDREIVSDLLNIPMEERRHPWSTHFSQDWEVPLLRIFDIRSGSRPDQTNCLKARAPRQRLDTYELRKTALTTHANYRAWQPTPFISFTTSPERIKALAEKRTAREPHTVIAIDPNRRSSTGLPILNMATEMEFYMVADPYQRSHQYFCDEYICLWEVADEEIIGSWEWSELDENWYVDTIMPAFRNFRRSIREPTMETSRQHASNHLIERFDQLSLNGRSMSDPSDPYNYYPGFGTSDSSSAGEQCVFYDEFAGTDTDDEVEEANWNDDLLKMIEGDW